MYPLGTNRNFKWKGVGPLLY